MGRKTKRRSQSSRRKSLRKCQHCGKPYHQSGDKSQSGGDYRLATDMTVDGIPLRGDAVFVRSDGSSITAAELKASQEA